MPEATFRPRGSLTIGVVEDHPLTRHGIVAALAAAGFGSVAVAESTEGLSGVPDLVLCDLTLPPGCRQGGDAIEWLVGRGSLVIALSQLAGAEAQLSALGAGAQGFVHKSAEPGRVMAAVDVVAAGGHWIEPQLAGWLLQALAEDGAVDHGRDGPGAVLRALAQGDSPEEHDRRRGLPAGTSARVLAGTIEAHRVRHLRGRPSPREREVIDCIGRRGLTVRETAAQLDLSESTVRTHLQAIKDKYVRLHPAANPALTPKMIAILWTELSDRGEA